MGWEFVALLGLHGCITYLAYLADVTMGTKVCIELVALPAQFSLALQWIRIGKHFRVRQA
jgi:hypothetical protein